MSHPVSNNNVPSSDAYTDLLENMLTHCNPKDPAVAGLILQVSNKVTQQEMLAREAQAKAMQQLAGAQGEATQLKTASIISGASSQMIGAAGSSAMSGMQTAKETSAINSYDNKKTTFQTKLGKLDDKIKEAGPPDAADPGVTDSPELSKLKQERAQLVSSHEHDMHMERSKFEKSGTMTQALGQMFHASGSLGQGFGQAASENAENAKTMSQAAERGLADAQKSGDSVVDSQQGLANAFAAQVKASVGA